MLHFLLFIESKDYDLYKAFDLYSLKVYEQFSLESIER